MDLVVAFYMKRKENIMFWKVTHVLLLVTTQGR